MTYLPLLSKHFNSGFRHMRMLLLETLADLGIEICEKAFLPQSQGLGIVASDIFDFLDDQGALRFLADMVEQLCNGREVTTGKYIMVYEAF